MKKNDASRDPGPEGAIAIPASESSVVPMRTSHTSWWIWAFSFQAVVLFAFSFLTFYVFRFFMPDILPVLRYAPSLLLVAGSALFIRSIFRRKLVQCFSVLLAVLWIMYMMCATIYLPALERFRPVKDLCRIIETQLDADDEAGYFRTALPSMVFYLQPPDFRGKQRSRKCGAGCCPGNECFAYCRKKRITALRKAGTWRFTSWPGIRDLLCVWALC